MSPQIPSTFKDYANKKSKMTGQNGVIEMKLQVNEDSKTYISSLLSRAPFLIQKAIYPEINLPNFPHVYIMSSSGGILQGDEQKIQIVMGKSSSARITTQSATKIYKMDNGHASQYINLNVQEGSYLEFIPHQIIPFKSSRFYQEVNLEVEKNAVLIYSEIISAGRIASGEKFDFDLCFLRTSASRNGRLLFADVMSLNQKDKLYLKSVFGGKFFLSSIYIIGNSIPMEPIIEKINLVTINSSFLAGCSSLPNDSGIIVRILADSASEIMSLTESICEITRVCIKKGSKMEFPISNQVMDIKKKF